MLHRGSISPAVPSNLYPLTCRRYIELMSSVVRDEQHFLKPGSESAGQWPVLLLECFARAIDDDRHLATRLNLFSQTIFTGLKEVAVRLRDELSGV